MCPGAWSPATAPTARRRSAQRQVCRACRIDSECAGTGPGVCMSHPPGLSRATDDETVYVTSPGTWTCPYAGSSTLGSSQTPFCDSQLGINATQIAPDSGADGGNDACAAGADASADGPAMKSVPGSLVVMRVPNLTEWAFNATGRTITVVGVIERIDYPGIAHWNPCQRRNRLRAGLRVTMASATAVIIADGGELHLDRCVIDGQRRRRPDQPGQLFHHQYGDRQQWQPKWSRWMRRLERRVYLELERAGCRPAGLPQRNMSATARPAAGRLAWSVTARTRCLHQSSPVSALPSPRACFLPAADRPT